MTSQYNQAFPVACNARGIRTAGDYGQYQYPVEYQVVASSNQVSWTLDSTFNALFANFDTMPLPGNIIGPDGWFEIYVEWTCSNTNTGNNKVVQLVWDHTNAGWTDVVTGSNQSSVINCRLSNRGLTNLQIAPGNQNPGVHANFPQSLSMDFTQDHSIAIFGTIIGSGDAIKIERWSVTAHNPPSFSKSRLQYGTKMFYGANSHFDDSQSIAFHIAGLKTMGMKIVRLAWEGPASTNALINWANALAADGTGIQMLCCLDIEIQSGGVIFATEQLAYSTTFTNVFSIVSILAPLGVKLFECGNENDTKNGINTGDPSGGRITDFSNSLVPIFRGMQRGAMDAIHAVNPSLVACSNAYTICSIGLSDCIKFNINPDGSPGSGPVNFDCWNWHNYEDYGPLMGVEAGNARLWINIYDHINRYYGGVPIMITEWNSKQSDTDAQRAAWGKRTIYELFNNRHKYNIAAMFVYELYGSPWALLDGSANTPIVTFGQAIQSFISANPDTGTI